MALRNLALEIEESGGEERHAVRAMRKHLAWYVGDLPGSKEIRTRIFVADTYAEVEEVLCAFAALAGAAAAAPPAVGSASFEGLTCDPESLSLGGGAHARG